MMKLYKIRFLVKGLGRITFAGTSREEINGSVKIRNFLSLPGQNVKP